MLLGLWLYHVRLRRLNRGIHGDLLTQPGVLGLRPRKSGLTWLSEMQSTQAIFQGLDTWPMDKRWRGATERLLRESQLMRMVLMRCARLLMSMSRSGLIALSSACRGKRYSARRSVDMVRC